MSTVADMEVKVTADIKDLQRKMDQAGGSVAALGQKFKPMIVGSNQAGQALTNLGRVAQDLPFGFLGIANNLNPLLESFQRLKAETGTTKGALKALGSSLIGAGGLGFALSIVSSAFLIFQNGIGGFGRKTNDAKKNIDDIKDALDKYVKTLDDVTAANLKGSQSAQEQLVSLQTLYAATQNANIPLAERKKLVDELQDQYPKYFQNISDETILAGGATSAYNKLATAILSAARARAAQESLVEIQKQILTLERQQIDNANEQLAAFKDINKAKAQALSGGAKQGQGILFFTDQMAKSEGTLNEKIKEGNGIQSQKNDLLNRALSLTRDITKTVEEDPASLLKLKGKEDKTTPKTKRDIETIADVLKALSREIDFLNTKEIAFKTDETKAKVAAINSSIEHLFKKFGLGADNKIVIDLLFQAKDILERQELRKEIFNLPNLPTVQVPVSLTLSKDKAVLTPPNMKVVLGEVEQFGKDVSSILNNMNAEIASGIGDALASAFSGQGDFVKDLFGGIFSTLGEALQQLGKVAIAAGIGLKSIKLAFESLNPAVAIAAGIGLVALGGIIKNSVAKIPKFATGVRDFGGGLAMVGERGPELVSLPRHSSVTPNGQFNAMTGGNRIEVFGRIEARGDTLLTIIDRAVERRVRNG